MTGGPAIMMYHSIGAPVDAYSISPPAFRRQLELIAREYRIVRLRDIRRHLAANEPRQVAITFDDAFGDFLESALPVLSDLSIPCTLFVPTGCIGGWNIWDRDHPGVARKRIMTEGEVRTVCATGLVDLGSHTVDHARMSRLPRKQMLAQAAISKTYLEDTFNVPIEMFSYPYGQRDDFSTVTSEVLADAGYRVAVTTCWGTRNAARQLMTLRRISLTERDTAAVVRRKLDGYYDWIAIKELVGYTWRSRAGMRRMEGDEERWIPHERLSKGN